MHTCALKRIDTSIHSDPILISKKMLKGPGGSHPICSRAISTMVIFNSQGTPESSNHRVGLGTGYKCGATVCHVFIVSMSNMGTTDNIGYPTSFSKKNICVSQNLGTYLPTSLDISRNSEIIALFFILGARTCALTSATAENYKPGLKWLIIAKNGENG